jgi:hypothetical protein
VALFRKPDFSLGRGAKWGAQERGSKPIRGHITPVPVLPWHIPGDHIALVPYLVPIGALPYPCPTPCAQGAAWCLVMPW